jgi:hypothetical protein
MKFLQPVILGALVVAPAFGDVVLKKRLGGIAHLGRVDICEIHDNHPDLKGINVSELAIAAQQETTKTARHVVAQVPSIELIAMRKERFAGGPATTKIRNVEVVLLADHSDLKVKDGKASSELMHLIEKLCK